MKEGDLITTYHKGFFRLKRIERRFFTEHDKLGEEYSPLYFFTQEYDANGNPKVSNVEKSCDAQFCKPAKEAIELELTNSISKINNLEKILVGEEKPYWKELKQKYLIPLPKNATDKEIERWYKKDQEQSMYLIDKYGSYSWRINELANTLRNEDISESHFRELVRFCFKELENGRI